MDVADWVGWCGSALTLAAFYCSEARRMRPIAVCANLAMLAYGVAAALPPVFALHALLLPVNLWRWAESLGVVSSPES